MRKIKVSKSINTNNIDFYDPKFYGFETAYKTPYGFSYGESVKSFMKKAGAYWMIDVIGSYYNSKLRRYPLLICYFVLDQTGDENAPDVKFFVQEDTGMPDIVSQDISFSDLIVNVKFYLIDGILMFPSDY